MDKIFHIEVTYSIKRYKKHANRQHHDDTNTKQLWQQLRFLYIKRRRKSFNFNSSWHRQYNESFQTCSKP